MTVVSTWVCLNTFQMSGVTEVVETPSTDFTGQTHRLSVKAQRSKPRRT
jgi:hypothetical protein